MIIIVDAMGGDYAPDSTTNGCIDAINAQDGFDIVLVGDSEKINKIIKARKFNNPRLTVQHASEVITNEDMPTKAVKNKKDSSMVVGLSMLKAKKGDVFLSAGNTGALMAGSLFTLGRIKGIDRPALSFVLPTKKGITMIIDAGANTVCKPINFFQFGLMGSIYMSEVYDINNPKVGLVNVGAEDTKGNDNIKQAYTMMSESKFNFIGNVEGRDILEGTAEVVVCDGFVGNVILKFAEGVSSFFFGEIRAVFSRNIISKLLALVVKKDLKNFKKSLDYTEYGGVPLLGINGKVIKSHGSSNAKAIKNAIVRACSFGKSSVLENIRDEFKNMEVDDIE